MDSSSNWSPIGTGIFNSPSVIFTNTQSVGISLLLFGLGGITSLAGVMNYIEFGLTVPRWPFGANGEKVSTPRSGDNLNYVCLLVNEFSAIWPKLTAPNNSSTIS